MLVEANSSVNNFIAQLANRHYSGAFIQHLVDAVTVHPRISTLQEIYEVIQKESQLIIDAFSRQGAQLKALEYRDPLCFESLRDYFHAMTRGVYKKHGSDIQRFKEGLKTVSQELIQILAASTSKIVRHSDLILRDSAAKTILVYSYSKSVVLSLRKLARALEDNLLVLVCKSGILEEGSKLYDELVLEGVRCQLIGDNEAGYYMHRVDCVLVGAQAILDDGSILNRAGTFQTALLAKHYSKPFYVFAESYKFLRRNYLSQADIPQRFTEDGPRKIRTIMIDLTPSHLISMFCTDHGVYNPQTIALELAKILK